MTAKPLTPEDEQRIYSALESLNAWGRTRPEEQKRILRALLLADREQRPEREDLRVADLDRRIKQVSAEWGNASNRYDADRAQWMREREAAEKLAEAAHAHVELCPCSMPMPALWRELLNFEDPLCSLALEVALRAWESTREPAKPEGER